MIDKKDFLHGAALVAIADSSQFTALNKEKGYGHYIVNYDKHVFIKHTDQPGPDYKFTYQSEDMRQITEASKYSKTFAVLVCSRQAIAAIPAGDLGQVIDLESPSPQWLKITGEPGRSLRVCGPRGRLPKTLPRKAFPEPVLG